MIRKTLAKGFTLLEVLVTMLIVGVVMYVVIQTFDYTITAREEVSALGEPMQAGPKILNLMERDLRSLWHYNMKNNRVLNGQNRDRVGIDADHIDLICARTSAGLVRMDDESGRKAAVCEVGYWIKSDPANPELLQLWRREDPLVDDDPWKGGSFQLVHDRLRSFNLTYYETLGKEAEGLPEWDSEKRNAIPRRIKIEFEIERVGTARSRMIEAEVEDFEGRKVKFERNIVLDDRIPDILTSGIALVPVRPAPPEAENAKVGGGGQQGGGGQRREGGANQRGGPGGQGGPGGPEGQRGGRGNVQTTIGEGRGNPGGIPWPPTGSGSGGVDLGRLIGGARGGGQGGGGGGRR